MAEKKFQLKNKADEKLAWHHEGMHTPTALTPLAGDYMGLVLEGINARHEDWEIPQRLRVQLVNGFLYVAAEDTNIPRAEIAEKFRQIARAKAPAGRSFWENEVLPTLFDAYARIESVDAAMASLSDLSVHWEEVWRLVPRLYNLHFQVTAIAYQALEDLADAYEAVALNAHPGEALTLVQGLTKELQRTQHDMHQLAAKARAVPGLENLILTSPEEALSRISSIDGVVGSFREAFDHFLRIHGHLGQAYDDLRQPSWTEDPLLLISELARRLGAGNPDPSEKLAQQLAEAKRTEEALLGVLADRPDELAALKDKISLARDVGPLTEDHNYWIDRMLHSKMRAFVLGVGSRMAREEILSAPDDIFFLHFNEVPGVLGKGEPLKEVVNELRAVLELATKLIPPPRLGNESEEEEPPSRFGGNPAESDDPSMVKGSAACAGKAIGPARIVLSTADFAKVGGGDILVCPSSNPSYVPLFGVIAGLVTDTGGVTSHAAVVAREFGVPAVVGTRMATKSFVDGDLIEVDGFKGEVRKL